MTGGGLPVGVVRLHVRVHQPHPVEKVGHLTVRPAHTVDVINIYINCAGHHYISAELFQSHALIYSTIVVLAFSSILATIL
jgi:hypothetical protein